MEAFEVLGSSIADELLMYSLLAVEGSLHSLALTSQQRLRLFPVQACAEYRKSLGHHSCEKGYLTYSQRSSMLACTDRFLEVL